MLNVTVCDSLNKNVVLTTKLHSHDSNMYLTLAQQVLNAHNKQIILKLKVFFLKKNKCKRTIDYNLLQEIVHRRFRISFS